MRNPQTCSIVSLDPRLSVQTDTFDAAVIGGGINGCTTALHLARFGMKVAVVERKGLCMEASGVNASTLGMQSKRASLIPYALMARELWASAPAWLGIDVGYRLRGGLQLAFTLDEARLLEERMTERSAAGAPIEFVTPARAKEIEPALSGNVVLASYCPLDGFGNASLTGRAYRGALVAAGVHLFEGFAAKQLDLGRQGFKIVTSNGSMVIARRVVLAGGVWLQDMMRRFFGIDFPVICSVAQVSVTERLRPIFDSVIGVASSVLTLKQHDYGTVLIAGGWQGIGDTLQGGYQIIPENLIANLRLAQHAIPSLKQARIVRTWLGLEAHLFDYMPAVGAVPGIENVYVIGGVLGGWSIGPYMGKLLAQRMTDREPEMPLFDPARVVGKTPRSALGLSGFLEPASIFEGGATVMSAENNG